MISIDVNTAAVVEQKEVLERALSTNPKTQKALQKLIRKVILDARNKVVQGASRAMKSDPRGTRNAVRNTVYKQLLGANINLFTPRKAHGQNNYEPTRTLREGQRGGNRIPRSVKTERMMSYAGYDRGMVLRWINDGTNARKSRYGNRGAIAPRGWFINAGTSALAQAANQLSQLIETELEEILSNKK